MEKYLIFAVSFCFLSCVFCSGKKPSNLGMKDGLLAACPDSPNCVSSQAKDPAHFIEPIVFQGNGRDELNKIINIIKSIKRTKIIESNGNYVRAEFTSAIFRFVDDVEFHLDEKNNVIHVRSASRVGYSDMGVNRKRIEMIRQKFIAVK